MQKEKVNQKRKTCLSKAMLIALQDQIEILKSVAFQLFARYCALHTLAFLITGLIVRLPNCTFCAIVMLKRLNALAFNYFHLVLSRLVMLFFAFFSFFGSFLSLLLRVKEKETNIEITYIM